ncbi:MAG: DUF1573 domain-containing protein [Chitinivibrionales bacterium]|nr:DUF1573 domain-containing protein [Chitinivibrionales bacterium]
MEGALMKRQCYGILFATVAVLSLSATAQPRIEPEAGLKRTRTALMYDVGEVWEQEQTFVRHAFVLRNPGTKEVRIREVRAGCHCTVVEFDSTIPPGGEGVLLQEVDLHGFRSGPFVRTVEVRSNALGAPQLKLGIGGVLRTFVEVDKQHLRVRDGVPPSSNMPLLVRSRKADLRIEEVVFKPLGRGKTPWRPEIPIRLLHQVDRTEEPDDDGYYLHTLTLGVNLGATKTVQGVFLVRTNHPHKPETGVRGVIDKS